MARCVHNLMESAYKPNPSLYIMLNRSLVPLLNYHLLSYLTGQTLVAQLCYDLHVLLPGRVHTLAALLFQGLMYRACCWRYFMYGEIQMVTKLRQVLRGPCGCQPAVPWQTQNMLVI